MRSLPSVLLVAALCCGRSAAQDPTAWSVEQIEAKAKAIAEAVELEPAVKEQVANAYAAALEFARAAAASEANAAAAVKAVENAPRALAAIRERLVAALPELPAGDRLAAEDLARLEERLREARAANDGATAALTAKENERQRRTARLLALPGLLATAGDELSRLRSTPIEGAPDDAAAVREARGIRRAVRLHALQARVAELEAEKRQYEAEAELLALERDALDREATRHRQVLEVVDEAVQDRRRADAAAAAKAAERQAQTVPAALAPLAERNQQLTTARESWVRLLATARADLDSAKGLRQAIDARFAEIQRRIDLVGLTDAIGLQLRQEKARLPSVRRYMARIEARRSELDEVNLARFDLEEQRQEFLRGRDRLLPAVLAALPAETGAAARTEIETRGAELLQRREEYFGSVTKDLESYWSLLLELDTEERQLVGKSQSYADFVNEHALWIPSAPPIWGTDWDVVGESIAWLVDAGGWRAASAALLDAATRRPARFVALALLALLLIGLQRPAKRRIAALAQQAANTRTTGFAPTAWVLVLTVIAALGWPLLAWHMATLAGSVQGVGEFPNAAASGLAHAAVLFGALELFRQAMRPSGLAEAHLRWPVSRTRLFRRNLAWFVALFLPCAFLLRVLTAYGNAKWGFMLDRLVLVGMQLVIAVFLARVLHPARGALAGYEAPGGMWSRTRPWFVLGVGAPLALAVVAAAGYHFSALELLYRLEQSLGVTGLAVLIYGLGMRWMLLAKRRLAMAQARARREAARAREAESSAEVASDAPQLPDETLSLASVDAQSRKLLGGGLFLGALIALWAIWSDVLPALRALEELVVWGQGTDEPVSLANVLLALLVAVVTIVAARNIPGLLELVVLQRLGTHAGERHAVTTLVRYLIVTVGVVSAFSSIGIGWGKVQWLVAAISVGLGFGLQEIFANFVSGIIILFERQVRVGDLVTVGEVDGYVTRIRMRATTIIDFDRKEMIVPNKEFVTARLVNWTLTDPITRIVIPVGIAYGSDTELARKTLMAVAADNELVLGDPAPTAIFRRFGDSTLDFELRIFIASRDTWPQVVDRLHSAIDREFRKAGLEIAFPQRDLHVRTFGPLAKLLDEQAAATPRRRQPAE